MSERFPFFEQKGGSETANNIGSGYTKYWAFVRLRAQVIELEKKVEAMQMAKPQIIKKVDPRMAYGFRCLFY